MYDSDMRALALNLAHGAGRKPDDVLSRARAYYGFLSRRDEAKAIRNNAATLTHAEIQEAMSGAMGTQFGQ